MITLSKPKLSLRANFEQIEDFNSSFLRTKMKVFAFGKNRNNSNINEAAFELAKGSIFNIPVVAKYTDEADKYGNDGDLEGHNTYLTRNKNGDLEIKQDTFPIGIVSSDANITYEEVNEGTEDNPDFKTYVVVDKVLLWKRYEATQKIKEWLDAGIEPKISMEIGNIDGAFSKEDNSYMVNSFEFEAIAALGSEIEPCFPMSQIEMYSKQTFEESFYEMIAELKFSIQQSNLLDVDINKAQEKGGTNVDEVLKMLQKYNLTIEDLTSKEIDHEQFSLEDLEVKVKEVFTTTEPIVPATDFTLTSSQLVDGLRKELEEIETCMEDYWGEIYTYPRYYYRDSLPEKNVVIAMDEKNWQIVGFNYSVTGDSVEVDVASLTPYKIDYNPMDLTGAEPGGEKDDMPPSTMSLAKSEFMLQAKEKNLAKQFEAEKEKVIADSKSEFEALQSELNTLKEQYSTLEERANSLESDLANKAKQEREDAETAIFQSFSAELTDVEMEPVKSKSAEMSLDDIETKLFALVGKKKAKLSFSKVEDKPLRMSIPTEVKKATDKEYADLIEKYSNK